MTLQAIEDGTKVAEAKAPYEDDVAATQHHSKSQVSDADSMATAIASHVPYTSRVAKSSTQITTTAVPVSPFPATIDELIKLRAEEAEGTSPIVSYPSKGTDYIDYTPQQLDVFTSRAAAYYASIIPPRLRSSDPVQVIGLLGPSRFEYYVTLLALSRLGHTVLFLSTRISEEAHANLLEKTGATTLLYDVKSFTQMAQALSVRMSKLKVAEICHSAVFTSSNSRGDIIPRTQNLDPEIETSHIAWIIHSSGSTGLPKPIFQTHKAALRNYSTNMNLRGFITLPAFHAHGLSSLFRAIHSRKRIWLYNADLPLAKQHLIDIFRKFDIQIFYGVPYALKLLAEDEEGIRLLAKLDMVMFGGSACPQVIGDKLTQAGVHLVSHYGTTETGQLMTSFRTRDDKDWDYVRPSEALLPYLRMVEQAPGLYEVVVLPGWPSLVMSNNEDGSYATKDLFMKHVSTPNAWKYYARIDDTIVLVNGEKTNPLLVEGTVRENKAVEEAVVFGNGKGRLGIFVVPASKPKSDKDLIDSIWPAVENMNKTVEAYAQLSRDMVKILPADSTYPKTDKGTVIRHAFYRQYANQIEAAYEETAPSGTMLLSESSLRSFLRDELLRVTALPEGFTDDSDLFSLGVDSLQASRLRHAIVSNIKTQEKMGQNIVFDFPSLRALAAELFRLSTGEERKAEPSIEEKMTALIEKYGSPQSFLSWQPVRPLNAQVPQHKGECIIVTGATGSLGAHTVAQLAKTSYVDRVYCLVRARSSHQATERLSQSLHERKFHLPEVCKEKLIAIPANTSLPTLGLDQQTYNELAVNVTAVLHCAWSVNFNLSLESFEDNIAGTRHLIDLCLCSGRSSGPASFNFCSSVSAVAASPSGSIAPEALPEKLSYAQGMGYAQSKLVTEHICMRAAAATGMKARVLRVGQIIGDTQNGVWNATEAIPMIFQCAKTIGVIPKLDENPSWLPVDVVATAIIDHALSEVPSCVLNVVNHRSFHWTRHLLPLLREAGLEFEKVEQREWVARLRKSETNVEVNPPYKLLSFFEGKYDHDEPRLGVKHETSKAREWSPALRTVGVIDGESVKAFVTYLQSVWEKSN